MVDADAPPGARRRQRPSLVRLCSRVLAAAGGSVALDVLAEAIAPRLGLGPTPVAHTVDDRDVFDSIRRAALGRGRGSTACAPRRSSPGWVNASGCCSPSRVRRFASCAT